MIGHYKRSKFLAERVVENMIRRQSLPAVIVNPSTPIGPRDLKPTPTGRILRDAAAGRIPAYVNTGLNLVHVDDVARAIIKVMNLDFKKINNKIFNIVGENIQIKDIGKLIKRIDPKANIKFSKNITDNRNYKSSNKRALNVLKFKTKFKIQDGVNQVVKYTKKNKIKNIFSKKYINILNHLKF